MNFNGYKIAQWIYLHLFIGYLHIGPFMKNAFRNIARWSLTVPLGWYIESTFFDMIFDSTS